MKNSKNLVLVSLLMAAISACSNDQAPTPQKLSENVHTIPANSIISVLAEETFKVPNDAQIIEKSGSFKTIDNIYDDQGNHILIPRNAIISGTYINDGVHCKIVWRAVYANKREHAHQHGTFALGRLTQPAVCDPQRGIKSGDRITINFNPSFE